MNETNDNMTAQEEQVNLKIEKAKNIAELADINGIIKTKDFSYFGRDEMYNKRSDLVTKNAEIDGELLKIKMEVKQNIDDNYSRKEYCNGVRALLCAMLSNPIYVDAEFPQLLADAKMMEDHIQHNE